ncbi:hypothetical protein LSTR_LSTR011403 [Laodelphax striatellus]|uniref:Uncharacterized protein n=1 Tax=Laodelphax striatellus TaxID=195883 RepID=A0A482WVQ8_LAOST|nr:hypothetical protein LSTR_LSTR011403 [Laodelphax striatellus]
MGKKRARGGGLGRKEQEGGRKEKGGGRKKEGGGRREEGVEREEEEEETSITLFTSNYHSQYTFRSPYRLLALLYWAQSSLSIFDRQLTDRSGSDGK